MKLRSLHSFEFLFRSTTSFLLRENYLLKDAWTIAIETLSWMEMEKLSERLALARNNQTAWRNRPKRNPIRIRF